LQSKTLNWEKLGRFIPAHRTFGQHRRFSVEQCNAYLGVVSEKSVDKTICYARVSSHDQKQDILRQAERLTLWCEEQGIDEFEVITDPGSGLGRKIERMRLPRRFVVKQKWLRAWPSDTSGCRRSHRKQVAVATGERDE
jgi:predicted site-specific integrase-resolvase